MLRMDGHELVKIEILNDPPAGRLCKNGHVASGFFYNINHIKQENRFMKLGGPGLAKDLQGVYCEYCIAVATALAKVKKHG